MRYSNTAIRELSAKYRSVLKKCALLNAAILLSAAFALPAGAAYENISLNGVYEDDTTTGQLIYKDNQKVTWDTANINILSNTTRAVQSSSNGSANHFYWTTTEPTIINLGGSSTENITITTHGDGVLAHSKGTINLTANNKISISSDINDGDLDWGTVWAQNSSDPGQSDGHATINLKANQIDLSAPNATAITAMSEGIVNIIGNANITGKNAILTRGYAETHINTAGDKTVIMNGDIDFDYDKATSGTSIDATVDVTLNGTDSSWTGNTVVSYDKKPEAEKLQVNNATINLKNGAKWNATQIEDSTGDTDGRYYTALNNLNIAEGTVNIADASRGIYVDRITATDATFAGGPLNVNESMSVSGSLDISNGSIVNTGTLTFASGSSLKALLNGSTIISGNTGTITGTTELVLGNGADGQSFALQAATNTLNFKESSLYSFEKTVDEDTKTTTYTIAKKSTSEVVDNLVTEGATAQEAATISAIADTTVDNPVLNKITEVLQSGDVKTAAKAAQDLAPTTSQTVMGVSKDLVNMMANVAGGRMVSLAGRSGGDTFKGGSMWVQGLYNHTKQDSTARSEGFKADSEGIAFGIDGKLNDALTIGLGYGYTKTNADAGNRDVDVDGNNVFAYAEYSPDAWYVNGVLNFGYGRYTEKKSPMGYTMKSKYDVYTYGANLMTGYAFESGLTPEGGLRYLLVDQKSYDDGVEKISTSNNDVLTAVLGAKYGYKVKAKDWMFTPNVRLAATYDLMSDGSQAVAAITGGSSYQISGERLHRFGMEAGVGVTSTWNNWDFTVSYDGGFRRDYQSHTGSLKAKYHF